VAFSREQGLNLTLSLLLHALVLAVAMGGPLWGGAPVRPVPVIYNVSLVALPAPTVPPAPAAAPAPAAPAARPTPAPRAVAPPPPPPAAEELTLPGRSRPRRESPSPTVAAQPAPRRPLAPPPAPAAPQAVVPTPFAAPVGRAAAAPPVVATEGTDVEATVSSGDPAAATYTAIISERVRRLWEPPGQGRVVVNARVLRSRFVRDVEVVGPSGNPLFDMSAVRAIQEAVPYPPFPPLMREEYVDIAFTFTGMEGRR